MLGLHRFIASVLGSRGGSVLARRFQRRVFNTLHRWPEGLEVQGSSAFVLSFDCETERDVAIFPELLRQLEQAGVHASFAVIGALAERFPGEHQALVEGGHEVFNHGFSEHTSIGSDGAYNSTLLYNGLSQDQMLAEITKGAAAIEKVCGVAPVGFRAPHFGTLKASTGDIERVHGAVRDSGARYSSSISALEALRLGRRGNGKSVLEFPLASHPGRPVAVLDSWSTVAAFGDSYVPGSLRDPIAQLLGMLAGSRSPRFASIYLDPVQVFDLPEFADFLSVLQQANSEVSVLRYSDLVRMSSTN